ncbi:sigma-70 family RNA polymerase sigma factor [Blastopirellula sp. JC732]|uniref:Sigma-70 family RNA polymerase sigma factor n=1 Tax=Blastopirellula sediminis TaxID=2894196 RepID=A0A9X1MPU1_9BACT|nr:sigma-70 family RNA polymerase sigma factor [Blastopirellula sediminis]MCC9606547.1 sigma-70 family RNA polymerase sigma factor [Blastopirellula sediminis]MCC9630155.1 sigma-70 family RNA polymerase sigma factor [Blastopirellula sediminis]
MWPEAEKTEQLIQDAKEGDSDARDKLLERHRDSLRRMVEMRLDRKIRRRVDASDVVQDVLVEANRRLADYMANPVMPFHLWLRHLAQDRIIDAHRRHRGSQKRSVDLEQNIATPVNVDQSSINIIAQICDGEMTPAAAATMSELQARFEQAIAQLDEQDREVVVMRHFEQLSNQEVAAALGLSAAAASMRYLRALRRLRGLLGEPTGE